VAAFYASAKWLFYSFDGAVRRRRLLALRRLQRVCSEVEKIVHRMTEVLFAAEVSFRGLHRCMPEQKLNLFEFPAAIMAQLRAGPPWVVRCNVLQACFLAAGPDYVPDHVLGDATAPHLSQSGDRSKDFAFPHISGSCPLVESSFDPVRNGNGPNVATFADQVDNGPVSLAHLNVVELQAHQFRPAKTTTKQHGQHRVIALRAHAVTIGALQYVRTLLCTQPIARTKSELLDSFDTANASCACSS
jgi:hypothetical protein